MDFITQATKIRTTNHPKRIRGLAELAPARYLEGAKIKNGVSWGESFAGPFLLPDSCLLWLGLRESHDCCFQRS